MFHWRRRATQATIAMIMRAALGTWSFVRCFRAMIDDDHIQEVDSPPIAAVPRGLDDSPESVHRAEDLARGEKKCSPRI